MDKEHEREFTRMDLGIYIHSAENVKRTPSRAREASKVGLAILLTATLATGWASFFNLKFLPYAGGLAMIYVLCFIITPNESANEN